MAPHATAQQGCGRLDVYAAGRHSHRLSSHFRKDSRKCNNMFQVVSSGVNVELAAALLCCFSAIDPPRGA